MFPFAAPFSAPIAEPVPPSPQAAALGEALAIGRDLLLDPVTGDLAVLQGDLSLVADVNAIMQEAELTLGFLLGEWFLDITQGIPYLQTVLVKSPNLAAIESVFRDALLGVAGISSVQVMALDFNRSARKLTASYTARSDLGKLIRDSVTLGI